jgi:hypothetical protein
VLFEEIRQDDPSEEDQNFSDVRINKGGEKSGFKVGNPIG